jgi:hypothetical protein
MPEQAELDELVSYLSRTSRLTPDEARRVVREVIDFMSETPEDFIRRRHRALQLAGLPNSEIFARIATELAQWRFQASGYTERQIRRIIYG